MTERTTGERDPVARLLRLLPGGLAALAEGAWVSVVAALLAAGAHESAHLGPIGFALAAVAGLVAGRALAERPDWPRLAVVLTLSAGVVGWLADPAARAGFARLDLGEAITHHLGGWLAAVAFLRGSAHVRALSSQGAMETLLSFALPGLAIPVLIGGAMVDPWRSRFLDDARVGIVLFLAAATVGVGVARLAALRGSTGFDWRGNRAWLLLLVVLVLGISLIALPTAGIVGPAVQVAIAVLLLPTLVLGTIAGFRQLSRRALLIYGIILAVLVVGVSAIAGAPKPSVPGGQDQTTGGPQTASDPTIAYAVIGVGLFILFVVAILLLARLWARDALARRGGDVPEERWIDTGNEAEAPRLRFGRWRRRARRPVPSRAAEAYLAALDDLDAIPDARRAPSESPAEHAARLRRAAHSGLAHGGLALDLLAADYELARFGAAALPDREDRRAVSRWRRLRERPKPSA